MKLLLEARIGSWLLVGPIALTMHVSAGRAQAQSCTGGSSYTGSIAGVPPCSPGPFCRVTATICGAAQCEDVWAVVADHMDSSGPINYNTNLAGNPGAYFFNGSGPPYRSSFANGSATCTDTIDPPCVTCTGGASITLYASWVRRPEMRQCQNGGKGDPGKPVNVLTGNVWFDQSDVVLPGVASRLQLVRSYNSLNASGGLAGSLGLGWTHTYERSLSFPHANAIELVQRR